MNSGLPSAVRAPAPSSPGRARGRDCRSAPRSPQSGSGSSTQRARVRLLAAPVRSLLQELRARDADQMIGASGSSRRDTRPSRGTWAPPSERPRRRRRSGRSRASAAKRLRVAQKISSRSRVPLRRRSRLRSSRRAAAPRVHRRAGSRGRELTDDLAEGPEGDALAVGDAPADDDRRLFGGVRGELLREPRLPDPGRAENREHVQRARHQRPARTPLAEPGRARIRGRRAPASTTRRPVVRALRSSKSPGGTRLCRDELERLPARG